MNTGRWTADEHALFLKGLDLYGKEWKKVALLINSRTVVQIRTHAQKYFQKQQKERATAENHAKKSHKRRSSQGDEYGSPPKRMRVTRKSTRLRPTVDIHAQERQLSPSPESTGPVPPPTPRTVAAAITLLDQRTSSRIDSGKATPRTRNVAEWLTEFHSLHPNIESALTLEEAQKKSRSPVPKFDGVIVSEALSNLNAKKEKEAAVVPAQSTPAGSPILAPVTLKPPSPPPEGVAKRLVGAPDQAEKVVEKER